MGSWTSLCLLLPTSEEKSSSAVLRPQPLRSFLCPLCVPFPPLPPFYFSGSSDSFLYASEILQRVLWSLPLALRPPHTASRAVLRMFCAPVLRSLAYLHIHTVGRVAADCLLTGTMLDQALSHWSLLCSNAL